MPAAVTFYKSNPQHYCWDRMSVPKSNSQGVWDLLQMIAWAVMCREFFRGRGSYVKKDKPQIQNAPQMQIRLSDLTVRMMLMVFFSFRHFIFVKTKMKTGSSYYIIFSQFINKTMKLSLHSMKFELLLYHITIGWSIHYEWGLVNSVIF